MKKQTVTNILMSGVLFCVLLTGCAGELEQGKSDERKMDFDSAKELLGSFPNSRKELTALEEEYPIYMILHGFQDSGEEKLEEFRSKLEAGEETELIVVKFTVEGVAIIDLYYYDRFLLYRWEDFSRDAFGGNGENCFETVYESAWFAEETDTEGNLSVSFYGLCEGDMVMELFRAETGMPPWEKPPAPQEKQNNTGKAELDAELPLDSFEAGICELPLAK